jgi:N-acetylglucosamine repressor
MSQGTTLNHSAMKLANELALLEAIRQDGPITRVSLKQQTALSWGTITALTRGLVKRGIVKEIGTAQTGVGRRPVQLDLNRERNFVAGIRLGGASIRAVLMDLKGNALASSKLKVNAEGTRQSILKELFRGFEDVLAEAGVSVQRVAGLGIAAPGAVDVSAGTSLFAPHHPRWKNVPVRAIFEKRYGVPCFVDHVNNCTVLGERWFGHGRGVDDFLCVLLGTGLSVGISIGGEVYRGVDSTAGELGHIVLDPRGPACVCGKRGCLEAFASGSALASVGMALAKEKRASALRALAGGNPAAITAETMYRAAKAGDRNARKAFEAMGDALGMGIAMLINLFNPQRVILCGQLMGARDFFLPTAMRKAEEFAWSFSRKEIVVSAVEDPAVLGAAGMVLQEIFTKGLLLKKDHTWSTTASR